MDTYSHSESVHDRLRRHVLVDGFDFELDLSRSHGSWLVDGRTGAEYLDLYTSFASAPLGYNPEPLSGDEKFVTELGRLAVNKPANPDLYTKEYASFVETFARVLGIPELPHLFFVEGGALAVENALKCAFDVKSRKNERYGRARTLGGKALHLTKAFHGRSGYTMSLTNTDPGKTDRFPAFDWPRIDVPAIRFPLDEHADEVAEAERRALAQAEAAFAAHPHDIACFIYEPIQGEGGDNHMRAEFLQAMERLCLDNDALTIADEVQTGVGVTGAAWAHQQLDLTPDIVSFAKKAQVGGIMAGRRVDDEVENAFTVSGRLSSTWGGGLADMVRSRRLLEVIERDGLIDKAGRTGAWLLNRLAELARRYPAMQNVRGRGLLCAFDLPTKADRDDLLRLLLERERVVALPCGERSVRVRPQLAVSLDELEVFIGALNRVLGSNTFAAVQAVS